jgi:methyltransferase (TIGR00027 family)
MRDDGPSLTARAVAVARSALDRPASATGDPAADERLEADLVDGWQFPDSGRVRDWVAVRTAFFDAEVLDALARGMSQVVILGAGYDGRALRFRTPGVTFFEVDHPHSQADKRARLDVIGADVEDVVFLAHDLMAGSLDDALATAGHDAALPTLFMAEGLLRYLPEDTIHHLFEVAASRAAGGSVLAITFSTLESEAVVPEAERTRDAFLQEVGETVLTLPTRVLALAWLAAAGWRVTDVDDVPAEGKGPGEGRLLIRAVPAEA